MKTKFYIIAMSLLFMKYHMAAQNLIPNGDFELGPDSTSAEWQYGIDSTCAYADTVFGPDFWTVVDPSPDRLIEGDIPCGWDSDTAQSGKAYIVLGYFVGNFGESGKAILLSPLQKDSLYHLSYYLSLETVGGNQLQPSRIAFVFNNNGDSLTSPYVVAPPLWQYFDTVFTASANSTEMKIVNVESVWSGVKIDNVSLIKLTNTSVNNYYIAKKNVAIYPNPSTGLLWINGNNIDNINIYNTIGQELNYISISKDKNSFHLDVSHLSKGIFFIQIKTKQEIVTQKLLITN